MPSGLESKFVFSFEINVIVMLVSVLISVLFSLILIIIIKDKKFNYSRLMFNIVIGEALSLFSTMWFLVNIINKDIKENFASALQVLHLYFIEDLKVLEGLIDRINIIFFHVFQTYSLSMNVFICLEMIQTLRDPVSKVNRRVVLYITIIYIVILVEFILMLSLELKIIENNDFLGYILFDKNTYNIDFLFRLIKISIFLLYIIVVFTSIIYLILRFRKTTSVAKEIRNKFIRQHILSVVIYVLLFAPYQYYDLLFVIHKQNFNIEDYKSIDVNTYIILI